MAPKDYYQGDKIKIENITVLDFLLCNSDTYDDIVERKDDFLQMKMRDCLFKYILSPREQPNHQMGQMSVCWMKVGRTGAEDCILCCLGTDLCLRESLLSQQWNSQPSKMNGFLTFWQ